MVAMVKKALWDKALFPDTENGFAGQLTDTSRHQLMQNVMVALNNNEDELVNEEQGLVGPIVAFINPPDSEHSSPPDLREYIYTVGKVILFNTTTSKQAFKLYYYQYTDLIKADMAQVNNFMQSSNLIQSSNIINKARTDMFGPFRHDHHCWYQDSLIGVLSLDVQTMLIVPFSKVG
ncbi:hypothetical protein SERLA73DRAFT_154939 [Serpula lacrymans var. lacrymans S7.3]|uniref:Uncharacterized protein n=1 Tax=Serpula lacrymans var. lacrymans (strain S7.3) TaxID=936435 RepID=F8Q7N2_SERL3|nr:hypothetical protein SERLA73DRAFT_154939 [Serpula lacrymans var. lacrymans S7.3]